jgi:hypothetical protein
MFKFILHTLKRTSPESFSTDITMNDSTLDLFEEKAEEEADLFAKGLEEKAKELEITVDYYMMEFL